MKLLVQLRPSLWNCPRLVPFQNHIRRPCPPTKMATMAKNRNSAKISLKSSSLKLFGQLRQNFGGMIFEWSTFRIVSEDPVRQPRPPTSADIVLTSDPIGIVLKNLLLWNAYTVGTKLSWNGPSVTLFRNYNRWLHCQPTPPNQLTYF